MVGIYKITNTINNKCYIGKSVDLGKRLKRHIKCAKLLDHPNPHLNNSFIKYGTENFTIEIIEECTEDELNDKEKYWINYYKSYDPLYGYNKTHGGDGGNSYFECLPIEKQIEVMNKIKQSSSRENNPNYGKKCYTDGIRIKYIDPKDEDYYIQLGWTNGVPEHTRKKEKIVNSGENNGFYGHVHTNESKQKMSDSKKGNKNPNYGKHIYHKDNKQVYISDYEIEMYIKDGWKPGLCDDAKEKIRNKNKGKVRGDNVGNSIHYKYNEIIFYGWRKLKKHLSQNGYPKISQGTITKLSNGEHVRGYDDLVGKIKIEF